MERGWAMPMDAQRAFGKTKNSTSPDRWRCGDRRRARAARLGTLTDCGTPSWTLFSGGLCFLMLACFYAIVDVCGFKKCAFPLTVIGMNSNAIYCLTHWITGFIVNSLRTFFGHSWPNMFGKTLEPITTGAAVLLVYWLILYWMYRRKLFLRV